MGKVGFEWDLAKDLEKQRKHGIPFPGPFDPYSSAAWFHGWCAGFEDPIPKSQPPIACARSWQLRTGFLLHGRLNPFAVPGPDARNS